MAFSGRLLSQRSPGNVFKELLIKMSIHIFVFLYLKGD